ncbi:MAG TPA: hypothetical protein VFV66_32945 [Nonomuraea sp.]|nr:hypothetical protein [Nonomuraea sp.]
MTAPTDEVTARVLGAASVDRYPLTAVDRHSLDGGDERKKD